MPVTATLDTLYYQDDNDPSFVGTIKLVEPGTSTIDVENDILGRLSYTSPNHVSFTNGLVVRFDDSAVPASYANNAYIVEGVGKNIQLINVGNFTVAENYGQLSGLSEPDYITINRASRDRNADRKSTRLNSSH